MHCCLTSQPPRSPRGLVSRAALALGVSLPLVGLALPASGQAPMDREQAVALAETLEADKIKILSHGEGDRSVVTLSPVAEAETVFQTRQGIEMTMSMGGMQMPNQQIPATIMVMRTQVDEVLEDGSFRARTTVEKAEAEETPGVNPMMAQSISASLAGMVGSSETMTISPRGEMSEREADEAGDGAAQQIRDLMPMSAIALPTEAIAPGARWQRKFTMQQDGVTVTIVGTTTLKSVTDTAIEIANEFAMIIDQQALKGGMVPPGAEVTVSEGFGTGSGSMVIDRRTGMPVSGSDTIRIEMSLNMDMGGQAQNLGQTMVTTTSYSKPEI